MHAVVRNYSGAGAKELFDLIESRNTEVEDIISGVQSFVAYAVICTDDGGVTVTTCQDKAGTDESSQKARDWVVANAVDLKTSPPTVSEGRVVMKLG